MRKRALIRAAITEVGQAGSLDVTVSQIACGAVSRPLWHIIIRSKDQILLAAMRHILREFGACALHGITRAEAPQERIKAIIAASFTPQQFDRDVVAAWLAFYVQAQNSPEAARLLRVYAYRLDSNLVFDLRKLVGEGAARRIAQGLASMIDGFYIRCALQDWAPDPGDARALVEEYLDMSLAREAGRDDATSEHPHSHGRQLNGRSSQMVRALAAPPHLRASLNLLPVREYLHRLAALRAAPPASCLGSCRADARL